MNGDVLMESWKILSERDIEAIHNATLRILSEVGLVLDHPNICDRLADSGATFNDGRVQIPPELVEESIQTCTKKVRIRGRNGNSITLGDGTLHWHNLGGARDIYNPLSGEIRRATAADVEQTTRLLDALDQATTVTPYCTPTDVPDQLMSLAMYRYALPHTTKPLQGPGIQTAREAHYAIKMAEVIGPANEVLTLSVSPVSPLTFPDELVGAMVRIAEGGIPFGPLPCPTAGSTAPMSIAGALTQQNAEVLASIVIAQAVNPGLPIIYCGRLAMMEPTTGGSVWGGIELGMASAATVQIAHKYGLPANVYGLSTNSHTVDIQSGYERALNALLPALAGADELSGIGEMAAGVTGSLAQLVIDNSIASSVQRAVKGILVNEESLAVDVIREVMKEERNFLTQIHTVNFLRAGEINLDKLIETRSYQEWLDDGKPDLGKKAQVEAERLLLEHEPVPLDDSQINELGKIIKKAEDEFLDT
jgi:trimethylamine--corrinoid protein Co-methyltransferase